MINPIVSVLNGKLAIANTAVVKVAQENNPKILSKREWIAENDHKLPSFWTDDYSFMIDAQYNQYLQSN
ncbi:MAG: hypothetical protein GY787_04310, partial [Alteromonadales bacterium]|nr:hypothetical protein [Alteromonadales bacterium]